MNLELELKDRVARRAIHLMPQPRTALRLRKLVADPQHSLAQVVDAIKVDPMLAAAVLRIANSASHCRGEPTTSLFTAVTRIGEKELARLALAAGLGVSTTGAGPLLALRRGAMQDALATALICECLAPEFGLDAEHLFLEGLLHDVGRLVALATLELILAQHPKAPPMEPEAWLALAQAHHIELGTVLTERWALPASVRQVIEVHHLPDDGAPDAASVVRLSDALLELLHAGVCLGEARLAWLERIAPARRAPLLEALTAVPSLVAAFEADRPAATQSAAVTAAPPRPTSEGPVFPVKVSGGRIGEVVLLSARRLVLHTDAQLADNHLEELELQLPGAPLKLWVRVTHSRSVGPNGRAEAEATPFAPTAAMAIRLKELACSPTPVAERAA